LALKHYAFIRATFATSATFTTFAFHRAAYDNNILIYKFNN